MAEQTTTEAPAADVIERLTVPPTPSPEPKPNTVTVSLEEWQKAQNAAAEAQRQRETMTSRIKSVLLEGTEGREQQAHSDLAAILVDAGLTEEQAETHAATLLGLGQQEETEEEPEEEEPEVATQPNIETQNALAAQALRVVQSAVKEAFEKNPSVQAILKWKTEKGDDPEDIAEWKQMMSKRFLHTVQQARLKHDQMYGPSHSLLPDSLDSIVGNGLKSIERELKAAFGTPENLGRVPGSVKEDPAELIKKKPKPKPVSERSFEEVLDKGGRNVVNLEVADDAIARIFAEEGITTDDD